MRNRLKKFMDTEAMSAKQFAERIHVQASSVSHILTGRNKPSIDFIEKLIKTFPDIDLKYLLTGNHTPKDQEKSGFYEKGTAPVFVDEKLASKKGVNIENTNVIPDHEIREIVSLYNDGTFKIYRPKK